MTEENKEKIKNPGLEVMKCCGGKTETAVGPEQGYYQKGTGSTNFCLNILGATQP